MSNLKLVYINYIGKNTNRENEYEFLFSESPYDVWGENWEMPCPSAYHDLKPKEGTYSLVKRLSTNKDFFCVQQNSCFSMQDCMDGIIALMWFYDKKGEPIIFNYGDNYNDVVNKLTENKAGCFE